MLRYVLFVNTSPHILNNFKVFQRICDAILVYAACHIVGVRLHLVKRIAHSHANASRTQHRKVVAAVAERHRFADVDAHVLGNGTDAVRLVGSGRRKVAERRIPVQTLYLVCGVG